MEELKRVLNNTISEKQNRKETNNELDQYNIYEKIDNKYVYNPNITMELNKIM